ncbi:MAG TPA: prealbumin-like fold domain-containing protein [Actinomycetota bacterium]|nr:prealbumin-like fold domain-containing protein [Actinomycetota bacterium]
MKDLVGPADFTLANCGTIIIRKVTDPSGDTTTSFGYTTNVTTTPSTTTSPFSLKDGEHNKIENVNPGSSLNVTEDDPGPGYALTNIDCSASTVSSANYSTDTSTRAVTFSIAAGETLDCTFTNTLQRGAIEITKTTIKDDSGLAGATFSITGPNSYSNSVSSGSDGTVCLDGLTFGDYTVTETAAPSGYAIDDDAGHTVTVDNNATCSDDPFGGETISFSDTPLSEVGVTFTSLAGSGVTNASIVCEDSTPSVIDAVSENGDPDPAYDDTGETFTNLAPGTYTCTVVVDP